MVKDVWTDLDILTILWGYVKPGTDSLSRYRRGRVSGTIDSVRGRLYPKNTSCNLFNFLQLSRGYSFRLIQQHLIETEATCQRETVPYTPIMWARTAISRLS